MAVTVKELTHAGSASRQITRRREYTRVFLVASDAGEKLGHITVRNLPGIPQLGAAYIDGIDAIIDASAILNTIETRTFSPESIEGTSWLVECRYASVGAEPRPDEPLDALSDNPLARPPSLRITSVSRPRELRVGKLLGYFRRDTGALVVGSVSNLVCDLRSSAREPYPDVPSYDGGGQALTWRVNVSTNSWSPQIHAGWFNALNSATFLGDPARTWRVVDIDAIRVWESATQGQSGFQYYDVTFTIERKSDGWWFEMPDEGTYYWRYFNASTAHATPFRTGDDGPRVGKLDGLGNPVTAPDDLTLVHGRWLPTEWPEKDFATIPGGPIT